MSFSKHTRRVVLALTLGALVSQSSGALASEVKERSLSHARVLLSDIVGDAPEDLAGIDLGPTPVPGSSRLIKRDEIWASLKSPGDRKRLKIPAVTRVVRKTKQLSTGDLEKLTLTALKSTVMPRGATLVAARPKGAALVPDGFDSATIELPRPPRREGKHTASATLTLLQGEDVLAKITVAVELKLAPEAAIPDVKKGEKVNFVIRRGLVEIRASASANSDADVGDTLQVTISESGKVLKGRLASNNPGVVLEGT